MQQYPSQPPPDQVVTVHTLPPAPPEHRPLPGSARVLGTVQVLGGLAAVLLGALLVWACSFVGTTGAGIWGGALIIAAGSVGICAGKEKTKGYICAYVFLSVVGALMAAAIVVTAALALALPDSGAGTYYCASNDGIVARSKVMECLMVALGAVLLALFIYTTYISCGPACSPAKHDHMKAPPPPVQYTEAKTAVVIDNHTSKPLPDPDDSVFTDQSYPQSQPESQYTQDQQYPEMQYSEQSQHPQGQQYSSEYSADQQYNVPQPGYDAQYSQDGSAYMQYSQDGQQYAQDESMQYQDQQYQDQHQQQQYPEQQYQEPQPGQLPQQHDRKSKSSRRQNSRNTSTAKDENYY